MRAAGRLAFVPALVLAACVTGALAVPPGEPARLTLNDLEGAPRSLEDERGRIVVLNFWATWCIPCRREMPLMAEAQERYRDRGIMVIAASADLPDRHDEVARFARRRKLSFPVWVGATTADMERLGLGEALPATAILDRDGAIVFRIPGPLEPGDLETRLDWLLGDRRADPPAAHLDRFAAAAGAAAHDEAAHDHEEGEEDHAHGGVGMEGASLVPS